jgi:hypothetical protein
MIHDMINSIALINSRWQKVANNQNWLFGNDTLLELSIWA